MTCEGRQGFPNEGNRRRKCGVVLQGVRARSDETVRGIRIVHVTEPPESPHQGRRGLRRLLNVLSYSLSGLRLAFRHESAFRQEIALAAVLIPIACLIDVSAAERALLFVSVLLVLLIELLNSSLEAAVDTIGLDTHQLAKRAKDLGSAAVLVALVMLATTWGLIATSVLLWLWRGEA